MGRFRAYSVWHRTDLALRDQYDYLINMDTGLQIAEFPCDPILQMVHQKAILGYFGSEIDPYQCTGNLQGLALQYLKKRSLEPTIPFNLYGFGPSFVAQKHASMNGLAYSGAFIIFKASWWTNPVVREWMKEWDDSGLCYEFRSDEQKFFAKTVGMFAPASAVHLFGRVWDPLITHGRVLPNRRTWR